MTTSAGGHHKDPRLGAEIGRIQSIVQSPEKRDLRRPGTTRTTGIRPANAATLVLVDRSGPHPLVLMGIRHHSLKFMPGALVFPGGRVDPEDGSATAADELHTATAAKIKANMRGKATERGTRAIALAAIREVAEETGILVGRSGMPSSLDGPWQAFASNSLAPSLSGLRLLARAITPPGLPRRFDTWFFVTDAGAIGHRPQHGFDPSGELESLRWVSPAEAMDSGTREITRVILVELINRLERDPQLDPAFPAPFYRAVNRRFVKSLM
jgi:8-oxo-dGTP pyrophosphatase MutT (NUDIX family)